jgi:superfamily I DNA and/or RNA helicase
LEGVSRNEATSTVMLFYDTAGFDYFEGTIEDDLCSKFNEGEAEMVVRHLNSLLESGVPPNEIAIITPYNAQVNLIKSMVDEMDINVEVGSVDGFQGREKEAIIISFVRSNSIGEIGFLSETRRTNVAITRARRHVCLVGDSSTLEKAKFYKDLIDYVDEFGDISFPS